MKVGYSATIWDAGSSGIGTYIAEQLDVLENHVEIELEILTNSGEILKKNRRPVSGSGTHRMSKITSPIKDVMNHRFEVRHWAEQRQWDVLHVPTVRRIPGKVPCPVVLTVHDLGPLHVLGKYGKLRDIYHQKIVPKWLSDVDAIVTPSAFSKQDLVELYKVDPEKITVVPNGVDHETFFPENPEESRALLSETYQLNDPYFVYISRLEHPAKNHINLLKAFEIFRKKTDYPHKLVCVGEDWNGYEVIRGQAMPMTESGDVILTGFVRKSDIPHFLRGATALVFPSLFEGFGLPVIEAMACGTPVTCSRSSAVTEVAEGKALLFDPEDPEEIAQSMIRLVEDEALAKSMSEMGISHAKNFTWARSVANTVAVWESVLES